MSFVLLMKLKQSSVNIFTLGEREGRAAMAALLNRVVQCSKDEEEEWGKRTREMKGFSSKLEDTK